MSLATGAGTGVGSDADPAAPQAVSVAVMIASGHDFTGMKRLIRREIAACCWREWWSLNFQSLTRSDLSADRRRVLDRRRPIEIPEAPIAAPGVSGGDQLTGLSDHRPRSG